MMKRLFARKDKAPLLSVTPPSSNASDADGGANKDKEDSLLTPTQALTRRKSSLFEFGESSRPPAPPRASTRSHSKAYSHLKTGSSVSGSSEASSSMPSTPLSSDEHTSATATPTNASKPWSAWMTSLSKVGSIKKSKSPSRPAPSLANVSRSLVGTKMSPSAAARPSTSTGSSDLSDDTSDTDNDSSDEEHDPLATGTKKVSKAANARMRGRKTLRAPGAGRQLPSYPSPRQRSVFGRRSVAAPPSPLISKALANLHALTLDALVPPTSTPPLVSATHSVPFPKSSNKLLYALSLSVQTSSHALHSPLHVEILRKRLLRRIERRHLTPQEQESVQPLASRSAKPRNAVKRRLPSAEETYEESKAVGGGWSKGMKRWALRPCFEERVVVYSAGEDGRVSTVPVERDARAAVAALEFSEGAEALAGLHRQNELPPPPADIYAPASSRKLPPPLVIPRASSTLASRPSNLLNPSGRARVGPSRLRSPIDVSQLQSTMEEDELPLGVIILQRRQKEEAEERRRKALVEKAERERKEEERMKRYKEEVEKARARRETEQQGILAKKDKDAWLRGDADALPPPPKPYAPTFKSSSNPNLPSSGSIAALQVRSKPSASRRMTSDFSAASVITSTTTAVPKAAEQNKPPSSSSQSPSPWTGLPSRSESRTPTEPPRLPHPIPHSNSYPRIPMSANAVMAVPVPVPVPVSMPLSAPPTQKSINSGTMTMPPMPDPAMLSTFERNLLRPWTTMGPSSGGGGRNGSSEALTPPRLPFGGAGVGSSGDSSGSLTPPRFPNSRPPSWGSSNEDVRYAMKGAGARPISIGSGSGESQEWRKSRSSWLVPEDQRARNRSGSPVDKTAVGERAGYQYMSTSMNVSNATERNGRSEKSEAPSSFSRRRGSSAISPNTPMTNVTPSGSSTTLAGGHSTSQSNLKQSSSKDARPTPQTRSRTMPLPTSSPTPPPKQPYGLPSGHSYGASSGAKTLAAMNGITDGPSPLGPGRSGLSSNSSAETTSRQRPAMHAPSKSIGAPQRKSRLFL